MHMTNEMNKMQTLPAPSNMACVRMRMCMRVCVHACACKTLAFSYCRITVTSPSSPHIHKLAQAAKAIPDPKPDTKNGTAKRATAATAATLSPAAAVKPTLNGLTP